MSDIRKYIDMVEGFMQPQMQRQNFGQKGTEIPKIDPTPKQQDEINNCKKFPTAEKYAAQYNKYGNVQGQPPHIRRWAEEENEALMARWNHWKQMRMF